MKEILEKLDSKSLIKIAIGAIIVVVCIVGFSLIYYNFFYRKSYEEIKEVMTTAAKKYYSEHQDSLPKTPGERKNIKVETLVSGEYMKSIAEYVKNEDIACKASVNITNINNKYRFNPLLDCGRYYNYELITDRIQKKEKIATENDGLYQNNEDLIYRGDKVNNYVKFNGASWRIIKISNNKLYLIYNQKLENTIWDDRYNKEKESTMGINNYSVSRIRDYINKLYENKDFISNSNKLLLSNFSLQTGKVGETDNDKNGDISRNVILDNQYIGLISINDFMNASLDKNCNQATSLSCTNYNYLSDYEYNYWTLTADKNTTHKVYKFFADEGISLANASSFAYIRPVISIVDDAIYIKGNGTENNPYIFE